MSILNRSALASAEFWVFTAERAVRIFAGVLVSVLTGTATGVFPNVPATGIHEMDWAVALSIAAGAAVVDVLLSISSAVRPVPISEPAASVTSPPNSTETIDPSAHYDTAIASLNTPKGKP